MEKDNYRFLLWVLPGCLLELFAMSAATLTLEQYHMMIEVGIIPEDSTIEMLRGILVRKDRSVIGEDQRRHSPLHASVVSLLTQLSTRISRQQCHLQIQLPIECPPNSEPEPDGSIIRGTPRDYPDRLPGPGDVSCVIEAAHSSLERDREDKLSIYAAAGVPQYVIINLQNQTIEIYQDPDRAGERYQTHTNRQRGQTLELQLPQGVFEIQTDELLP
jgi:Uma2 family endonuclease